MRFRVPPNYTSDAIFPLITAALTEIRKEVADDADIVAVEITDDADE